MVARLLQCLKVIRSFIPGMIPQTEAGLNDWCDEVLSLLGHDKSNASLRIAIFQMVLHLDSGRLYASKRGFVQQIRRSIANQAAYMLADDLKRLEKQKVADEQAKATNSTVVQEVSQERV